MEITIINGSPRKNGATFRLLNEISENIIKNQPNAEIHFFNLIDLNPKYCKGCEICYKTGNCIEKNDGIEEIHNIINKSNALILGCPTNESNITGLLKVFYDRVHMTLEQLLYKKPCIVITTYESAFGNKAFAIMKEMVMNSGGYVSGSMLVKIGFNEDPLNNRNINRINKITNKFIKNIQTKYQPLYARLYNSIAINIFLKPMAYNNKEQYQGIINKWKENNIIK